MNQPWSLASLPLTQSVFELFLASAEASLERGVLRIELYFKDHFFL